MRPEWLSPSEVLQALSSGPDQRSLTSVPAQATSDCPWAISPVHADSAAVSMFRLVLSELTFRCQLCHPLEERAEHHPRDSSDFQRLQRIPGIGQILALIILAEAGDLRRFHYRQFLNFSDQMF